MAWTHLMERRMADERCKTEQECTQEPWCRINGRCHRATVPDIKSTMHDDYKPLDTPQGVTLEACPVCGSAAALWQYSESETAPRQLAVMCTHGEAIGPQDGIRNEGCLLYMTPEQFYRETIRDAVRYWNEFAKALTAMRKDGVDWVQAPSRRLRRDEVIALISPLSNNSADHDIEFAQRVMDACGVRVPAPDQRAGFEEWAARRLGISNFDKDDSGVYLNGDTDDLWCCWQDAHADGVDSPDGGKPK
jgi:hypothetical protein